MHMNIEGALGDTPTNLQRLTGLLADAERVLMDVARQTQQLPLPKELAAGVEQTAYVHELMQRALAWQNETERLRQLLSDHPAMVISSELQVSAPKTEIQHLDSQYKRILLNESWIHQLPVAFLHRGSIYQMPRPSFREMYRVILRDLSTVFADTFLMQCKVLRYTTHLPMTDQVHVYNFAVFRYENYFFNIQLSADRIRQHISSLYDSFALSQHDFVMWSKN